MASAFDYFYPFTFDRQLFRTAFRAEFLHDPRYTDRALDDLDRLLKFIEDDSDVTDIRWMAYMMATSFHETVSVRRQQVHVLNAKGLPLKDKKGHPVMRTVRHWEITMSPVPEAGRGKGRPYYLPVKVKKLKGGLAQITEQDGDRYVVLPSGTVKSASKHASLGSAAGATPKKKYEEDDGEEISFYGRGYVQLTWWSNYATAGSAVGLGLDLLFDPEKVLDPKIAYTIMSYGMRTGEIFAHGRKFEDFFHGSVTNYKGARAMVNGKDKADVIAELAHRLERALLTARSTRW